MRQDFQTLLEQQLEQVDLRITQEFISIADHERIVNEQIDIQLSENKEEVSLTAQKLEMKLDEMKLEIEGLKKQH